MAARLIAFLDRGEAREWIWGSWDCCLLTADWIQELTGIDGGAAWRGTYRSAFGAWEALRSGGGIIRVVGAGASAAGLVRAPRAGIAGSVGILRGDRRQCIGAVCVSPGRWATIAPGGFGWIITRTRAIAAWTVGD